MSLKSCATSLLLAAASSAVAADLPIADWPTFMARQDLTWSSSEPQGIQPGYFNGAFVGDGVAGGMIFRDADEPQTLRLLMGRYDVIAHSSIPKLEYCIPRLFAGDILLTPAGTTREESMRLSLWDGQASGTIHTDQGEIT